MCKNSQGNRVWKYRPISQNMKMSIVELPPGLQMGLKRFYISSTLVLQSIFLLSPLNNIHILIFPTAHSPRFSAQEKIHAKVF